MTTATLEKPKTATEAVKVTKIIETVQKGYNWRTGEHNVDREVSVAIVDGEGKTIRSVSFWEGEPEDMTLFRDLSGAYNIHDLVKEAYELGRQGVEVEFVSEEYSEDEE